MAGEGMRCVEEGRGGPDNVRDSCCRDGRGMARRPSRVSVPGGWLGRWSKGRGGPDDVATVAAAMAAGWRGGQAGVVCLGGTTRGGAQPTGCNRRRADRRRWRGLERKGVAIGGRRDQQRRGSAVGGADAGEVTRGRRGRRAANWGRTGTAAGGSGRACAAAGEGRAAQRGWAGRDASGAGVA